MEVNSIVSLKIIYEGLWGDPVAQYFLSLILAWFSLAVLLVRSQGLKARKFCAITPSSLTTMGILGTFIGILLGLAQFDVNQIEKSVPALLDGMKLAFTTSITGIGTSLIYKGISAFSARVGEAGDQVTPSDILSELKNISKETGEAAAEHKESMEALRKAISSDNDSSLVTQVQKLRTTVSDGQDELIKEFKDFAANMAENNQKALIDALESVIKDFNEKLTEQFGENFKQLNQAVEKLVIWQEEYRKQLEIYQERLEAAVGALESTEEALQSIRVSAEKIPEAVDKLDPAAKMLITQLEMLEESLKSIQTLREQTDNAFPTIEQNLERITSKFSENVSGLIDKSSEAYEQSQKSFSTLSSGYDTILETAKSAQDKYSETLQSAVEKMSEQADQQFIKHGQLIETSAAASDKAIQEAWKETTQKISSQFENFDKEMQQELSRAMEQLGKSLASISEKFVNDYTPLTQKLQQLVETAKRVN